MKYPIPAEIHPKIEEINAKRVTNVLTVQQMESEIEVIINKIKKLKVLDMDFQKEMKAAVSDYIPEIQGSAYAVNADTMEVVLLSNDRDSAAQEMITVFNDLDQKYGGNDDGNS